MSLTVDSVNDARIDTSGDPNMYADEGELVDVTFTTPDATEAITWSATGLPTGLTIDSATGRISGRPQYDQAQVLDGEHPVALTATAADGDTATEEFTWHVADVNRLPWIDDQANQEFDHTTVDYYAHDNIDSQSDLTYSFSGLPAGIYSPNDSLPPGTAGEYDVTISVAGGGATDARTYHWSIVPAAHGIMPGQTPAAGVAHFSLNDTYVHTDDVGLVGLPMPITAKLFLTELDYMNVGNNSLGTVLSRSCPGTPG